ENLIKISLPETAYMLGYLWADGNVIKDRNGIKMVIDINDANMIKSIMLKVIPWKIVSEYSKQNNKYYSRFYIYDKRIKEFFVNNDYLIKSGASACKILSKIPIQLHCYWWRGYFDGDGCFCFNTNSRGICSVSRVSLVACFHQDWLFLIKLFKRLKISFKIIRIKTKLGNSSVVRFAGYVSICRFYKYIYAGVIFGLDRKRNIFLEYFNYKNDKKNNKKCKYIGVTIEKRNKFKKYVARISYKNKLLRLGYFYKAEDAAIAYNEMAIKLYQEKAQLNIV
ncbi:MAG: hypothetical protein AABY22_18195, partial [Nanoarchaeota archaeon]